MGLVPEQEHRFAFKDGDVLALVARSTTVYKILKVVKVEFKKGSKYIISGQQVTFPHDDWAYAVAVKYARTVLDSLSAVRDAFQKGTLRDTLGTPVYGVMRVSRLNTERLQKVGFESVTTEELKASYLPWKQEWDAGTGQLS
ncbi:hypothetical protein GF342_05375 [Candidatus Woesearchaeota archaeon]|nr:hypothetical protein [Candidatus Woesearchaeota archaeon]